MEAQCVRVPVEARVIIMTYDNNDITPIHGHIIHQHYSILVFRMAKSIRND